jgi:hypothetical protein
LGLVVWLVGLLLQAARIFAKIIPMSRSLGDRI